MVTFLTFLIRHRLGGPLLLASLAILAGLLLGLGTWAWCIEEDTDNPQ